MTVSIVLEQGTHLLIADGRRYAVIERRNGHFYSCHGDSRAGTDVRDLSDIGRILDSSDWMDRQAAQTAFDAIVTRGNELAQGMR